MNIDERVVETNDNVSNFNNGGEEESVKSEVAEEEEFAKGENEEEFVRVE
jgi:hypothetical protein